MDCEHTPGRAPMLVVGLVFGGPSAARLRRLRVTNIHSRLYRWIKVCTGQEPFTVKRLCGSPGKTASISRLPAPARITCLILDGTSSQAILSGKILACPALNALHRLFSVAPVCLVHPAAAVEQCHVL